MNDDRPVEPVSSIRSNVDTTLADAQFSRPDKNVKRKGKKNDQNFKKMLKDARKPKETGEEQE